MSNVIDIDKGWSRILKSIKDADKMFVKAGILSTAGTAENGMSMAKLGTIHEYGAPKVGIPARPFMRQTFERIRGDIVNFNKKQVESIILGKSTAAKSLKLLGVYVTNEIKREFTSGKFEENKPSTIRAWQRLGAVGKAKQNASNGGAGVQNRKFKSMATGKRPLIATGRLRNSINFEVSK